MSSAVKGSSSTQSDIYAKHAPSTNASTKRQPQVATLTGMRAVLIAWIVLYHLQSELTTLLPVRPLIQLAAAGFVGVDFFFITSGFIIAYNYATRFKSFNLETYGRFLWLRLARIYPVHLFSLLLVLLMFVAAQVTGSTVTNPENYSLSSLIQNLFLVQTWTVPTQFSWNAIAWAVSNEWLAYLTFPIIIGITLRIRSVPAVLGSIFVLLWGMTAACLLINNSLEMAGGAGSYGLLRVAGEFVAGCLMYNLYSIQWGKRWNWSLLTSLSWLAALIGSAAFISYGMSNAGATIGTAVSKLSSSSFQIQVLSLTPLYAFAIYALAWQRGPLAQLFSTKLMMLGGHLSYSLYLTHYICLIVLRRVLPVESVADGNIAVRFLVLLIYLVIMLAAAAVTYRFVEEPGRLWMKARFKRKRDIRVGNYR